MFYLIGEVGLSNLSTLFMFNYFNTLCEIGYATKVKKINGTNLVITTRNNPTEKQPSVIVSTL